MALTWWARTLVRVALIHLLVMSRDNSTSLWADS